MATKQLNSRIQWKRDTSAHWESNNPILLDGEIIIVTTNAGETRFKVGDGAKTYTQLPFQDEAVRALITELSETVDTKLTTPVGSQGQFLGYTSDNMVEAITLPFQYWTPFNAFYTVTMSLEKWNQSGTLYYYDIEVPNIGNTSSILIFPKWLTGIQEEEFSWNNLTAPQSFNGFIRIYSYNEINIDIGVDIYYTISIQSNIPGKFNKQFDIVLNPQDWVLEDEKYFYQIAIEEITNQANPILIPQYTMNINNEIISGFNLQYVESFDGYIKIYSKQLIDLPLIFSVYYNV